MDNKKINAIIQARMGSTRLPGKVLMEIEGTPILYHIIRRLKAINGVDHVIVATSIKEDDDAIAEFCHKNGIPCVRGSEENVLDRFGLAAKGYPADIYIRATGDNPMIDIKLIEEMLAFFYEKNLTYTCYKKYPIGSGVEIFTHKALAEALENAEKPYELEHVTPYMYLNMRSGNVQFYVSAVDDSNIRMTVDTENDLQFARALFEKLYKKNMYFGIAEIKELLEQEPILKEINANVHQKTLGE